MSLALPVAATPSPALRAHFRSLAPAALLVAAYALIAVAASRILPEKTPAAGLGEVLLGLAPVWLQFAALAFVLRACHFAFVARDQSPLWRVLGECRDGWRLANFALLIGIFLIFMVSFGALKQAIPYLHPFSWDAAFAAADRMLHAGHLPHEWLLPWLGAPGVLWLLNQAYNIWFLLMWIMVLSFAWETGRPALRMQFFLAYFATWALAGNLAATVLSSAGPCFYGKLGIGPDPYAGLMQHLHAARELAQIEGLRLQETLWQRYESGANLGISAMPSMHNASSLLLALAAFRVRAAYGLLMAAFTLTIFAGSILLGWHYAVDAYAGWAMAGALWWAAGRFSRWWHSH